ncbi:hypothetical protein TNCV_4087811, partial [Trichonephila clavipes]
QWHRNTKQTAVEESYEEVMDQSQNGHDQNAVTPEQVCKTLQFLFQLARSKENKLNCLRIELLAKISIYSDEGLKKLKDDQKRLDEELKSTYDKPKQLKRAGQEEFKLPKTAARTIKEIPIEQVICTSSNKFVVKEVEDDQTSGRKAVIPSQQNHHAKNSQGLLFNNPRREQKISSHGQ